MTTSLLPPLPPGGRRPSRDRTHQHRGLVDLFDTIASRLTQDAIIKMSRQVESDDRPPDEVAGEWVRHVLDEATRCLRGAIAMTETTRAA